MRLARLGQVGAERPVLLDGDRALSLSGITDDYRDIPRRVDGRLELPR